MLNIKAIYPKTVRKDHYLKPRESQAKENIVRGEFGYKKNIDVIQRVAKINILQRLL